MKNKIKLSLAVLAMLVVVTNSSGMVKPTSSVRSQVASKVPAMANILSLPNDLIVNKIAVDLMEPTLEAAGRNIRALAHSNKKFLQLINHDRVYDSFIDLLVKQHKAGRFYAIMALRMNSGRELLKISQKLWNPESQNNAEEYFLNAVAGAQRGKVSCLLSSIPKMANASRKEPSVIGGSRRGATALELAAERGYSALVDDLLNAGADIGVSRSRLLIYAARSGNVAVVRSLLAAGAKAKVFLSPDPSWDGIRPVQSALGAAIKRGHLQIVDELIRAGADVNYKSKDFGRTPLHNAAGSGNIAVVERLLDAGARFSRQDYYFGDFHTPLYDAQTSRSPNREAIMNLLRSRMDLQARITFSLLKKLNGHEML